MAAILLASLLYSLSFVTAEVIHLTEADFSQHVDGSSNILVEFYAPW